MACHPADPPGLPFGYQGVDQWDSPDIFGAIKRYESIVDSPYNGFQLDLGNAAAGLKDPATEVLPIVQYLGQRGKIHQIHMRNIRGSLNNFYEVFPDEGEVDFSSSSTRTPLVFGERFTAAFTSGLPTSMRHH